MPLKPPSCPDCGDAKTVPIVYGEPTIELAEEAERGEVVFGGCILSGSDPAWDCRQCGRRFGDAEGPRKALVERTIREWVELIETMVPRPCSSGCSTEVVGGEPPQVIVRVDEKAIHILEAELVWESPSVAARRGSPFAKLPLKTSAARVAELITAASAKRLSRWRWCPRCHAMHEPELMTEAVCHGCAEKVLGVVF